MRFLGGVAGFEDTKEAISYYKDLILAGLVASEKEVLLSGVNLKQFQTENPNYFL
jgi:hypothetical protein